MCCVIELLDRLLTKALLPARRAHHMGVFFAIVVFIVIVVFVGIVTGRNEANKERERIDDLDNIVNTLEDFTVTRSLTGFSNYYRFLVDEQHKKVCYISGSRKLIIPFSKILSVELIENGNTKMSKSTARTIGGALVGGAIAGTAGAIVGGLSGNSRNKHMVSTVKVKVRIKDSSCSSLTIEAFNSKRMIASTANEIDTADAFFGKIYRQCLSNANTIIDMVSVIIDEVDREKCQPNVSDTQNKSVADELKKLVELKSEGVLSQSEFDAQKAKLLGSSSLSVEPEIISEGELSDEVRSFLDSGNMIQAMNQYIKETGASLSEAKSVLESYK